METTSNKVLKKNARPKQTLGKNLDIKTAETIPNHSQQKGVTFYHRQACIFMRKLKSDYKRLALIYNCCIKAEQERERRNNEEIDYLKKVYGHMQVERADIKRKRWCRYCESEATYLSSNGTNFYCSQECEQKQNELVSAMNDILKT